MLAEIESKNICFSLSFVSLNNYNSSFTLFLVFFKRLDRFLSGIFQSVIYLHMHIS